MFYSIFMYSVYLYHLLCLQNSDIQINPEHFFNILINDRMNVVFVLLVCYCLSFVYIVNTILKINGISLSAYNDY